jgi:hypothetical protein
MKKEKFSSPESENRFRVYCGVSESSFEACMSLVDDHYVFDKSKYSKHEYKTTFYMDGVVGAMRFAVGYAKKYGGQPIVISGKLDAREYDGQGDLPEGEWLNVDKIVVFTEEVKWNEINIYDSDYVRENIVHLDIDDFFRMRASNTE